MAVCFEGHSHELTGTLIKATDDGIKVAVVDTGRLNYLEPILN